MLAATTPIGCARRQFGLRLNSIIGKRGKLAHFLRRIAHHVIWCSRAAHIVMWRKRDLWPYPLTHLIFRTWKSIVTNKFVEGFQFNFSNDELIPLHHFHYLVAFFFSINFPDLPVVNIPLRWKALMPFFLRHFYWFLFGLVCRRLDASLDSTWLIHFKCRVFIEIDIK